MQPSTFVQESTSVYVCVCVCVCERERERVHSNASHMLHTLGRAKIILQRVTARKVYKETAQRTEEVLTK